MRGSSIYGWWDGFVDRHSAIVSHVCCVGSQPLLCDVLPPINVTETSHTFELLSGLEHGQQLCVSVRAVNQAGLSSMLRSSDCVRTDGTPPDVVHVGAGLDMYKHMRTQACTSEVTYYSLLTTHYSLLTTHYSLLTTHYSYYSLLTTHYSLLTTHYLLLTTSYSLPHHHYILLTTS